MTSVLRSQPHISTSSLRIPLLPPLPPSALNPGDHVVEQEEDQDQAHGDVAEDAAVVSAGSHHGGEALHAAAQQTRRTEEVGVLNGERRSPLIFEKSGCYSPTIWGRVKGGIV